MALCARRHTAVTGAVAIFVKTPGYSALKTRLAAVCGRAWAEHWYALAAAAVASVAQRACDATGMVAYWAVAEAGAQSEWPHLPTMAQGDGTLGERMARVHTALVARHGFALLIGADSPQLSADALIAAARWLEIAPAIASIPPQDSVGRFALGPASDGGFWLFGSNRAVAANIWTAVGYSQPHAGRDLQHAMRGLGEWHFLDPLTDVDHADDLEVARLALEDLADPTPAQLALARWMREAAPVFS